MPYKSVERRRAYDRKRNAGGSRRAEWDEQFKHPEKHYLRPWERRMIKRLAEAISIAEAARQVGCSYKAAWDCARGRSKQRQLGHGDQGAL